MTEARDPELERRKSMTFAQAEGIDPLPAQLDLKQVSRELRSLVWYVIYTDIKTTEPQYYSHSCVLDPWRSLMFEHHVLVNHAPADEFSDVADTLVRRIKKIIWDSNYHQLYGFLQYVLRSEICPDNFAEKIEAVFVRARAPVRIADGDTIMPVATEQEAAAVERALQDARQQNLPGATAHIRLAAEYATKGEFADSIRESIHAVESAARMLRPGTKSLEPALAELEKVDAIHGGLRKGFAALYGFASDEKGIRHPLLDKGAAKVSEADALFMLGACSAFISYLINRARSAGLLEQRPS